MTAVVEDPLLGDWVPGVVGRHLLLAMEADAMTVPNDTLPSPPRLVAAGLSVLGNNFRRTGGPVCILINPVTVSTERPMKEALRAALLASAVLAAAGVSAAETITYTYDARGRLVKVVHSGTTNNGVQTEYTHDKADNRIKVKKTGA